MRCGHPQFEELLLLGANNTKILDCGMDSEDLALPLELSAAAAHSTLFTAMSKELLAIGTSKSVTYNNHECGITTEHFQRLLLCCSPKQAQRGV